MPSTRPRSTPGRTGSKRVGDVTVAGALLVALLAVLRRRRIGEQAQLPRARLLRQLAGGGMRESRSPAHKFPRTSARWARDGQEEELESRNEADGCLFKIRDDPRVTTAGHGPVPETRLSR